LCQGAQQPTDYVFLLLLLVAVRLSGISGDRSRKLPVAAKKTELLKASAKTGSTVSVKVRTPDCILEPAGSTSLDVTQYSRSSSHLCLFLQFNKHGRDTQSSW
jgi:hypothetical protein